jgi:hypothetical protein
MGTLVVKFIGICVHVDQNHFVALPSPHRVLFLRNPTRLFIDPRDPRVAVDAHKPKLFLTEATTIDLPCLSSDGAGDIFDLNRVALRVVNAKPPFVPHPTFASVPHLTELGASDEGNLGVIQDGDDPVGAYFDIDGGTLSACTTNDGAVITTLEVETFGFPILGVKCIGRADEKEVPFTGKDRVEISIANLAVGGEDNDSDYLLDFRVCKNMPADPRSPTTPPGLVSCAPLDPRISDDFSSACSNSNYP